MSIEQGWHNFVPTPVLPECSEEPHSELHKLHEYIGETVTHIKENLNNPTLSGWQADELAPSKRVFERQLGEVENLLRELGCLALGELEAVDAA